ncbi:MAG: NAD(P)H-quinone oxidoreductase subunit 3 [Gemmatimonadetes bacterium]|uniref:NADH-quinone oxidoreductase subunit A n=1 Tax=Candidatus Kutchimonas denitrificans TaxID=3056748 RepID=A0AAE4Z9M0_9BACT|nr:NAD(P)H-quinone oxidoreductase subunit 3 [Gemmatimonadota bacterium]NIR75207.1 NAD(P)H-quinone oxidoreductase subunit 3 [Candidatus Kutchimonas denitrificans]NIS00145.1 NAD(P)H-quinone oxidoreductase subunit 3 [Gemmatimonadota bacterium]NIT65737.1 NAD(P)H-quinone oxidoreductase subunit 3 [Gemmatimonadota bacterium]NIU53015.1 NAD(P)H-quinone oxidoreductase subunit 3 [Gemmatimonadota bacterium]
MLREYVPVLMIFAASLGVAVIMVVGSQILSNRRPTPVKSEPYESGMPPIGDTRERFAVKYYVVAMLFLLFDVEVVILFTWGIVFKSLGLFGYVTILIFLLLLVVGLLYEWRKGALEWER